MRMRKMRRSVREHDIFWWLESFLAAAQAKRPRDFPAIDEYIPSQDSPHEETGRP
jgi:trehalose-6-phosphate synthase